MKKAISIVLMVWALLACSKLWTSSKDKFIDTYRDLFIARNMISDSNALRDEMAKIYEKHGYEGEKEFLEAFNEYSANLEEFRIMIDSARERAIRELNETKYPRPQEESEKKE